MTSRAKAASTSVMSACRSTRDRPERHMGIRRTRECLDTPGVRWAGGTAPRIRRVDLERPPADFVEAGSTPFGARLIENGFDGRPVVLAPRNCNHPRVVDAAAPRERREDLYMLKGS
jgi:hypothetical protein